jgi:hypothetical protein
MEYLGIDINEFIEKENEILCANKLTFTTDRIHLFTILRHFLLVLSQTAIQSQPDEKPFG